MASVITNTSTNTSHIPLFNKNVLASVGVLFFEASQAEVPERKTKTGAQKCVIQREKNNGTVVVEG